MSISTSLLTLLGCLLRLLLAVFGVRNPLSMLARCSSLKPDFDCFIQKIEMVLARTELQVDYLTRIFTIPL
jgi:hypothetical protein